MPHVVDVSRRAKDDLEGIYRFIQNGDSLHAERWFAGLQHVIASLANSPERCSKVPAQPKFRQLFYGASPYAYRIVFSIHDEHSRVLVRAVRHGSQAPFRK